MRRPGIIPDPLGSGITPKAFGILLGIVQVRQNAVSLSALQTTGGGGVELVLPTDQEVSGGRVARALVTTSTHRGVARAQFWDFLRLDLFSCDRHRSVNINK